MTSLPSSPICDEFRLSAEVLRAPVTTSWNAVHTPTGRRARVTALCPPALASPPVVAQLVDAFREGVERCRRWDGADTLPVDAMYEWNGLPYAVTFLPDGVLLDEWLEAQRETRVPLALALTIGSRLGQALARAHENGLTHGCLRPANVFLDRDHRPRVCEFALHAGAARAAQAAGFPSPAESLGGGTGAQPGDDEWAADRRALAVILLQLLSGTHLETLRLAELASRLPPELPSSLRESIGRALTPGAGGNDLTPRALAAHLAFDVAWLQALEPVMGPDGAARLHQEPAGVQVFGCSGVQASGTEGEKGRRGEGESRQGCDGRLPGSPTPLLPFSPSVPERLNARTPERPPSVRYARRLVHLGLVVIALIVALVVGVGGRSLPMGEGLAPVQVSAGEWIGVQVGPIADQDRAAALHRRLQRLWPGALVRCEAGRYWVQVTTSAWPYRARAAARRLRAQGFDVRTVLQH